MTDEFDFHDCSTCNHALDLDLSGVELPSQQREQLVAGLAPVGLRVESAGDTVDRLAQQHSQAHGVSYPAALAHVLREAPALAQQYLAERHDVRLRPGSA